MYDSLSVLIIGANGRQTLPLCKALYELGCKVTTYCLSKLDTGYLTKYVNERILYNPNNDEKLNYHDYGAKIIESDKFDLVIPTGDIHATYLSKNKINLCKYAAIAVEDWDKYKVVIDKKEMMDICQKNNIPSPKTIISDTPLEVLEKSDIKYPIVIKPRTACGSIGFNIAREYEDVKKIIYHYDTSEMGPLLIQEYIPHDEGQYEAEVFRDRDGNIKACVVSKAPRIFPLDGGSPVLSISIHDEAIRNTAIDLANTLNWIGYLDIDFVVDKRDGCAKIIEANPRLGADVKLDFISGVNVAKLIVQNEMGFEISNMEKYFDGKQVVCGVTDILWLIKSKNRVKSNPKWIRRKGMVDAVFSISDIRPFVGFCLQHIVNYSEDMKKRKRL